MRSWIPAVQLHPLPPPSPPSKPAQYTSRISPNNLSKVAKGRIDVAPSLFCPSPPPSSSPPQWRNGAPPQDPSSPLSAKIASSPPTKAFSSQIVNLQICLCLLQLMGSPIQSPDSQDVGGLLLSPPLLRLHGILLLGLSNGSWWSCNFLSYLQHGLLLVASLLNDRSTVNEIFPWVLKYISWRAKGCISLDFSTYFLCFWLVKHPNCVMPKIWYICLGSLGGRLVTTWWLSTKYVPLCIVVFNWVLLENSCNFKRVILWLITNQQSPCSPRVFLNWWTFQFQQNGLTFWQGPALPTLSYKRYPPKHQHVSLLIIETAVQCFSQSFRQDQRAARWKASKESRRLTAIFWTSLPWWSAFTFSFSRTTQRQIQRLTLTMKTYTILWVSLSWLNAFGFSSGYWCNVTHTPIYSTFLSE